jgi:ornithine carbamoyltransferase
MTPSSRAPDSVGAPEPDRHADTDLLLKAEALAAASLAGQLATPLRGRNVGILCEDADSSAATLFASAASELGAHVVCIPITLTDRSSLAVVRDTAVLLARLYDAVECLDMSPLLVELMQESANVPLFFGLSSETHRTATLAARMTRRSGRQSSARRRILQAALVQALASWQRST